MASGMRLKRSPLPKPLPALIHLKAPHSTLTSATSPTSSNPCFLNHEATLTHREKLAAHLTAIMAIAFDLDRCTAFRSRYRALSLRADVRMQPGNL
jgi:hypothetical protein